MSCHRKLLCLALLVLAGGEVSAEPQLLHDESKGLLELQGETKLEIAGLRGEIHIRAGVAGKLRYEARTAADRDVDQAVALWADGSVLRLTGTDPDRVDSVLLEIVLPPELEVDVRTADSAVEIRSLHGDFSLSGARVRLEAFDLRGANTVSLEGGEVTINEMSGELSLEGKDVRAQLSRIQGAVTLDLQGGSLDVQDTTGSIAGQLDGTTVRGDTIGEVDLGVDAGAVDIQGLARGGELRLTDTELGLGPSRGSVTVDTDAAVRFQGLENGLQVVSHGGSVWGADSAGQVRLETFNAEVVLEKMKGAVTVVGDGITLRSSDSEGELTIQVTSSDVAIEKAAKPVSVESDFGDVTIQETTGQVHVTSRGGTVRATGVSAPIDLHADGYEVEVEWTQLGAGDSTVENAGGSVRASIPPSGQCQVRAASRSGVRSELDGVTVSPDGNSASGALNGGRGPKVEIRADGPVDLLPSR